MLKQKCNKYVVLFIIQIVIALILLPKCFGSNQFVYSLIGENYVGREIQVGERLEITGESMCLTPGVYQVQVWANVLEGQSISVEVACEDESFKSIRSNSVTVFPGDEYIDFEVYVGDTISTAYVLCGFNGMDASGLIQLDVYKTAWGNRMLLFMVIAGFIVLDGMMLFRKRILEGKVTKQQQVVFWSLTAGVLLAYFPYMTDYISMGYDTMFHISRIAHLKDSLLQGDQFPVRVQSTWLHDHGYAVSLFYGDLFIYIPAVLMIIGFSLMDAYKMFILLVMVATAAISYCCFKKCVKESYAALFGSMIYLLVPYRLLDVYERGAIGEFLAMTFLPLICCGMYLLYTEPVTSPDYKKYKWYIIWGITGLLQSHLLSTEMAVAFMALVCVVGWKKTFCKRTFVQLLQSVGLVLLINAWFWVPFLYMMNTDLYNFSSLGRERIASRGLLLGELFQFIPRNEAMPTGMWGHMPAQLGIGVFMLLASYILWHLKTHKGSKSCNVLATLSLLSLLLCTSFVPWNELMKLPIIGYVVASIQFPWRFMAIASVCAAMFAALFYVRVQSEGGMLIRMAMGIAGMAVIISVVYYVNDVAFTESAVYLYEEENIGTTSVVSAEYLLLGDETSSYQYHLPVAEEGLDWFRYDKEGTAASIMVQNSTEKELYIEIPLIGYKGYGLDVEGVGEIPYITEERGEHGDLRIAVPAGYKGNIQISYKGFKLFRVAEIISLVTLFGLLEINLYRRKKTLENEE